MSAIVSAEMNSTAAPIGPERPVSAAPVAPTSTASAPIGTEIYEKTKRTISEKQNIRIKYFCKASDSDWL